MIWAYVRTFIYSILWLIAVLALSFPQEVFSDDFGSLIYKFLEGDGYEFVFLPFLLAVDLTIALACTNFNLNKEAQISIFLCMLIYSLVMWKIKFGMLEVYSLKVMLFFVALFCLSIPKFISLLPPNRVIKMKKIRV